ncbi:MAG TPA: hypothetical protein DDW94_00425 [Deltaproteobacteria bacterium]|nr:MAG: hypothetical protein A2Z79_05790 [Deltaproteobacteria bacterium GWA2_55_82]OGQ62386.1 MAG: hypothetical protein A3I81_01255 [Deltaproteobacteria bacterium RIFCSPLOWO2_02_FULL_55_12]OIJ73298.1 MAG: hypothetical protein A2V21_302870 [Deltaproteobacteria bacterium GWC2_55_46]HBG45433.1 hypothetical protein [Deltaproteobacteria bacterium]HCY10264.1 hypothetical protein [Deltaproteobacteria bacterium]
MRKKRLGIRFQLTSAIVIMTLAGIGLIGLLSVKIVERSALFWKASQAGDMVRIVRASFRIEDEGKAAALTAAVLREAGISAFRLTGPDGRIAVTEGALPVDRGALFAADDGIEAYVYGGGWFKGAGESLRIFAPMEWQGKGQGTLELLLDLHDISSELSGARRFLFFYALLDSAIIIGVGILFLSRSVVSPLKRLEEAATRIAGGKLYERARVDIDNELGSLASSFNSMAERLEEEIRSLERVNLDLVTAQDELLRSSTLAAVGRLAAGIAHEIGNPLGALRGYVDLLGRGGLEPAEKTEIIEGASKEVARIDTIVREFLGVARPTKAALSPVDVNSLLNETLSELSLREDFKAVEVKLGMREAPLEVMADEGKLRQVFVNLLINAAHSMEGQDVKSIEISTGIEKRPFTPLVRRRKDDPPLPGEAAERDYVCVSFLDSGDGIAEEHAKRIFDPFFTTKEAGRGTGLGLFVSQSIIKAYGGEITFRTSAEGSVFTVALPAGRQQ